MGLSYENAYYIHVPYDQEAEELIIQNGKKRNIKAGEFLIKAGQEVTSIHYLAAGTLVHYALNDQGVEKVGYINTPGSFTNEFLFLTHGGHIIPKRFVMARGDSIVYSMDRECFDKIHQYPSFEKILMQSLYEKYRILRGEVDSLAFNSSQQRLLKLFKASMDRSNYTDKKEWIPLKITYTQQEMAAIIGVHRVSVARLITNLCKSGYIRLINHKIEVHRRYMQEND